MTRVVVNHLRLTSPLPVEVVASANAVCDEIIAAGGLSAAIVRVEDTHAVLVLTFPDKATEERISSSIGGPWMVTNVLPLLASPPERSSGELLAGALG